MRKIVLIANNLRSTHNVGSLLRTAEGLGIEKVYLTGYSPYPLAPKDKRLPHLARKVDKQISKTALGAQHTQKWVWTAEIGTVIEKLKARGYLIAGLEQTELSIPLQSFSPPERIAIVVGRETEGLEKEVLELTDKSLEIPMLGKKESFNVVQAAAMALYHLRFAPFKVKIYNKTNG